MTWMPHPADDRTGAVRETDPRGTAERVPLPPFTALPSAPERPFRPTQVFRRP